MGIDRDFDNLLDGEHNRMVDVIAFFKSWGLDAESDHADIPSVIYDRMCEDAQKVGGEAFRVRVSRIVNAVNGRFYLMPTSWDDVVKVFDDM